MVTYMFVCDFICLKFVGEIFTFGQYSCCGFCSVVKNTVERKVLPHHRMDKFTCSRAQIFIKGYRIMEIIYLPEPQNNKRFTREFADYFYYATEKKVK